MAKKMPVHGGSNRQPDPHRSTTYPGASLRDFETARRRVPVCLLALGLPPVPRSASSRPHRCLVPRCSRWVEVGHQHDHRQLLLIGAGFDELGQGIHLATMNDYGLLLVVALAGADQSISQQHRYFGTVGACSANARHQYRANHNVHAADIWWAASRPPVVRLLQQYLGFMPLYDDFQHQGLSMAIPALLGLRSPPTLASRSAEQPVTHIRHLAPHVTSSSDLRRCFASTPSPAASAGHRSPFGFSSHSIFFSSASVSSSACSAISLATLPGCPVPARAHQYDGVVARASIPASP